MTFLGTCCQTTTQLQNLLSKELVGHPIVVQFSKDNFVHVGEVESVKDGFINIKKRIINEYDIAYVPLVVSLESIFTKSVYIQTLLGDIYASGKD